MSDEVLRCVYCGGDEHPAVCGYTQAELDAMPSLRRGLKRLYRWIVRR